MITDLQYLTFLQKLHAATRPPIELMLPEWESNFLASFLQSSRPALWFTGDATSGRRGTTDKMWRRFGPEINFPHPLDTVSERPQLAEADADGCEYLMRDDDAGGRQRRCNLPATQMEPGKLRYCAAHAEAVERACKGTKLVPFIAGQSPVRVERPVRGAFVFPKIA